MQRAEVPSWILARTTSRRTQTHEDSQHKHNTLGKVRVGDYVGGPRDLVAVTSREISPK